MLRIVTLLAALVSMAKTAHADVIVACTFPTLPSVAMRFPVGLGAEKTMEVGGRPAVPLEEGQGVGRVISANVDGYSFSFTPENSEMHVGFGGKTLTSEEGRCVTVGGPVNETPLDLRGKPVESTVPIESAGRWRIETETSAFDDSTTVFVALDSNEPIRGQFGPAGPATLHLRCMENRTSLFLVLNDLFLSDIQGYGLVEYRIDDQEVETVEMTSSTSNKALGLWNGSKSIPMIKGLLLGQKVVFRATPFNESPVEFSFDLTGIDSATSLLRKACSW
jgi:type VI secretion system protein VasI